MQHIILALWQYEIKQNNQLIPYETTLTLTLSKRQLEKLYRIHHDCIELQRLTYFDRLPTHPVCYFNYKKKQYYRPFDIKQLKLDVTHLDYLYVTLHHTVSIKPSLKHPEIQSTSPFDVTLHRNQRLIYPKFCKWYLDVVHPFDPLTSHPMLTLYNFSFLCELLFTSSVTHLISWLNLTYQLDIQTGQHLITHRRCLSKFNRLL